MARKRVSVTDATPSGRNTDFHDNYTGEDMSRAEFVRAIQEGRYERYHVREIGGIATPVSNPDSSELNNLD